MNVDKEILEMAIDGYRARASEALAMTATLQNLIARAENGPAPARRGRPPAETTVNGKNRHASFQAQPRKRRKMSKAGRDAVAAAQRKRWAKIRAEKAAKSVTAINKRGKKAA